MFTINGWEKDETDPEPVASFTAPDGSWFNLVIGDETWLDNDNITAALGSGVRSENQTDF